MASKKIILISSVFIVVILSAGFEYYAFLKQNGNKTQIARECVNTGNPYAETDRANSDEGMTKKWSAYYDERYKYQIDFPAEFSILTIYEHVLTNETSNTNGGVVFSPADSIDAPGGISVEIFENSKIQSLDEWLKKEKSEYGASVVEKKISIDGNEALVAHRVDIQDGKIYEEYKQQKTAVFIKNNTLFVISAGMDDNDNEKFWNSFKFITGRYPIY